MLGRTIPPTIKQAIRFRLQPTKPRRHRAEVLLDKVGLADTAGAYPANHAGGQRRRVAIARALAMEPEVMLFDDPRVERARDFLSHLGWSG